MISAIRRAGWVCAAATPIVAVVCAADVLLQLGVPPEEAKRAVGAILVNGVQYPGLPAAAFKLLPPAGRADAATAGMAWIKTYTASAEFKQQYAKLRDMRKPAAPTFEGTPEDELKKEDAKRKADSAETAKALANLPAEQRAQIEEALKQAQQIAAQLDTPEMRKMRLDAVRMSRQQGTADYERKVAAWKQQFPEDPSQSVRQRLREFLEISNAVDFDAKTTLRDKKLRFDNAAYEGKPASWKVCYRAGREATTAARAAAQAWLKELGG